MPPEEPPRPKGPKVEPIDRRGKLMAFKRSLRREAAEDLPVEKPNDETPYERLKRLETDPAANLQELQATLTHFVPHLQLVEIECMLGQVIEKALSPNQDVPELPKGLYAMLSACQSLGLLNAEELRVGHEVRGIRNELFHRDRPLDEFSKKQITYFWEFLRTATQTLDGTCMEVRRAAVAPLDRINHSQREAGKISHLAAFIEIEQMLRKTMNEVLNSNEALRETFKMPKEPPGSIHALNAISLSRCAIADALKGLKFWDDIRHSLNLRHDLIHGRNLSKMAEEDNRRLRRAWGVLRHLPHAIVAKELVMRLERTIRELLISEGVESEVAKKLWIQKLSKRLCDERRCMRLLAAGGVGRSQILWLIDFSNAIFDGRLDPVTSEDAAKLRDILAGIEGAVANPPTISRVTTPAKTKHAAQHVARKLRKHPKARRGYYEDDFS